MRLLFHTSCLGNGLGIVSLKHVCFLIKVGSGKRSFALLGFYSLFLLFGLSERECSFFLLFAFEPLCFFGLTRLLFLAFLLSEVARNFSISLLLLALGLLERFGSGPVLRILRVFELLSLDLRELGLQGGELLVFILGLQGLLLEQVLLAELFGLEVPLLALLFKQELLDLAALFLNLLLLLLLLVGLLGGVTLVLEEHLSDEELSVAESANFAAHALPVLVESGLGERP